MSFRGVSGVAKPSKPERLGWEARFWKGYCAYPLDIAEQFPVTHLCFSPAAPHQLLVSCGARVKEYPGGWATHLSEDQVRNFTRFKDVAYGASLRHDGKLMVAGGEEGRVRIFNMGTKSILRYCKGHVGAVRFTRFVSADERVTVVSGGDDATVRHWDVSTGTQLRLFKGHTDAVRCGSMVGLSPMMWMTGSYDHTVRLWDARVSDAENPCVAQVKVAQPVECVSALQAARGVACVGAGTVLSVWDVKKADAPLQELNNHHKTLTSMTFNASGNRVLTASLDGFVKVYNMDTPAWEVVYSYKQPSPVLAIALAPDGSRLAVGMASGLLSIRRHQRSEEYVQRVMAAHQPNAQPADFAAPTLSSVSSTAPAASDYRTPVKVKLVHRRKRSAWDNALAKYDYRRALDEVLKPKDLDPSVVCGFFAEMIDRRALTQAMSGRDEDSVKPIVTFLSQNICKPHYSSLLIDVTHTLLNIYGPVATQSAKLAALLLKLRKKVDGQLAAQRQLLQLQGQLEVLINT